VETDGRCTTVCCNGKCCADNETCDDDGQCQRICLPLRSICNITDPPCCQAGAPAVCSIEANCTTQEEGARCCRPIGEACAGRCDCCENADCVGGTCRLSAGQQCTNGDECAGLVPDCCDSVCTELVGDLNNCGACGNVCQASTGENEVALCVRSETDRAGHCTTACVDGFTRCNEDGPCVALVSDDANCGACGNVCAGNQRCCGGTCMNINTDEANCGECGNACAPSSLCCGGKCKDVQSDPSNCGDCGNLCAVDEVCSGGQCALPACKANGDQCDENSDCCSGSCNGSVCVCSPGSFPAGGTCQTDANCCQGRCVADHCVCFPPDFPPKPGVNGPCLADRDCCSGSCLLDPTGNIGLCTCRPFGSPCDNQFQCCSGNCNGGICSPFD
jgi:hypothetical protein